ncbi:hypothetical protein ACN8ZM_40265 (plasmid) [Burkholderia aenigmatica]|uniref:hypothetical protein n=1 Tax=Burkholderia aenigmatica TaxID=2015348 RepID=UPI003B4300FF
MKKHVLAPKLAAKFRIPVGTADALLDEVRDHIIEQLRAEGMFVWRGLGTLRVRTINANGRKVRDPHGCWRDYPDAVRGSFMLTQAKAVRQLFETIQSERWKEDEIADPADH